MAVYVVGLLAVCAHSLPHSVQSQALGQRTRFIGANDLSQDEISFLEGSSAETDPVEGYAAASALHAQAEILSSFGRDSLHNIQRLQYKLLEKEKQLRDRKNYAKRIDETIAEDLLVLGHKEHLAGTQTGKILLQVATEELAVLRMQLTNEQTRIDNETSAIALTRKAIAVQEAGASELSRQLKVVTPRVRAADVASCKAATTFADAKIPPAKRLSEEAVTQSNRAVQNLQTMVLKCGNGVCALLPDDAGNESTTPLPRFAAQRGDDDDTTTTEPQTSTAEPENETTTEAPKESPEQLLARFQTWLQRPNALMPVLRATEKALQELEAALQTAQEDMDAAKEAQRQSIASAEGLRFQGGAGDEDTRIAQLARDIIKKELKVHRLLAQIALQRAAFLAVRRVAKTRIMHKQAAQMHLASLQHKADVDTRCRPLLKTDEAADQPGQSTTEAPQPPRLRAMDVHIVSEDNSEADEMF